MQGSLDNQLGFAPDYDSTVPYMQRTRDYYTAIRLHDALSLGEAALAHRGEQYPRQRPAALDAGWEREEPHGSGAEFL